MQTNGARSGRGGCVIGFLAVMAVFVVFWIVGGMVGLFGNHITIPDYRNGNARSAELTTEGNRVVNIFYDGGKREGSTVKAFITKDAPAAILNFYRTQTGFAQRETAASLASNNNSDIEIYYYEKSKQEGGFILLVGTTADNLVQGHQAGETYIIVAEGKAQ